MAKLSALPKYIEQIQKAIPLEADRAKREASAVFLKEAVNNTPVDTSKALSNWQIGVGSISGSQQPAVAKGKFGSTRTISANATIAAGESKLKTPKPKIPIFISNHLSYIELLNNGGHSNQAGAFVELALLRAKAFVKAFKFRLTR